MVCCEPQKLQEISELCCLTVFPTEPQEILSLNSSLCKQYSSSYLEQHKSHKRKVIVEVTFVVVNVFVKEYMKKCKLFLAQ